MINIGRNDYCHCGSGKKYKKCCLEKDESENLKASVLAKDHPDEDFEEFEDIPNTEIQRDAPTEEESQSTWEPPLNKFPAFPKPPQKVPDLSPEHNRIVEDWWKAMMPLYGKRDTGEMIRGLEDFMKEYPDLVVHLGLESEFLFELGADLGRKKEWSRFANLLIRIRKEHPEMYVRSFSYYDRDIITELVLCKRFEEIPRYFNFFHQYPDSEPDNASEVIDLLAWTDRQNELFEFVKPIAMPIWISPDVLGGWFALRWLVFAQYVPLLESGTAPEKAAKTVIEAVKDLNIPNKPDFDMLTIQREFEFCLKTPTTWNFSACKTNSSVRRFYHDVSWNYCAFIHDVKGFSWTRAYFLSDRLKDYWLDMASNKKPKEPFRFNEANIDKYISRTCKNFFTINGVRAVSLLEALWHFADYLFAHSWLEAEAQKHVHDMCRRLFDLCMPVLESTDPVPRLISEFPEMKCLEK